MIDRSSGGYGLTLRSPDLRLGDVRTSILSGRPPFKHRLHDPERAVFVFVRRGNFTLDIDGYEKRAIPIAQGAALGFDHGRAQTWRAATAKSAGLEPEQEVELFISSIPRRMGILQTLEGGFVAVPPDAAPYSKIIQLCIEVHAIEACRPGGDQDDAVVRRTAEICLIQLIRYVRANMSAQPAAPAGLLHDEYLLRAWAAYFADPQRRWTVQALADAAGLSRTAFAERFRKVFGAPPLQTLTTLRLEQAESMLRHSKAPLIEIAFNVGYHSEAAFVRAFHRQYGMPPGRFRSESAR